MIKKFVNNIQKHNTFLPDSQNIFKNLTGFCGHKMLKKKTKKCVLQFHRFKYFTKNVKKS